MGVRITSHLKEWTADTAKELDIAMLDLATTIQRDARNLAPRETGALIASGKVTRAGQGHYIISFGGGRVPYAKRRHYENKKNPQTLHYLERAGDANSRNIMQFISKRGVK